MKAFTLLAPFAAQFSAAATLTLQCGGSVRLPGTLDAVAPRLVVDGTETIAVGEEAATPEGVRFEFRAPGRGVLATGECTMHNAECVVATWRFKLAKEAKKVEWGAVARLPHEEFSPEDVIVNGNGAMVRGLRIAVVVPECVIPVLADDSRRSPYHPFWRLLFNGGTAANARKGDLFEFTLRFDVEAIGGGLNIAYAGPFVVPESGGWVPMDHRKTILPGSALDFTGVVPHDAPAGKHGFLRSVGDHVEFEGMPGLPQRFYGVNLCQSACFPEKPEEAEMLAERIFRLGYNAVRIHHHDWFLARYENGVLVPIQENMDKLDRLIAECVKRGIYLTTDLHVSRRAAWRDFGIDRDGDAMVKAVQFTTDRGFRDWCDFTRLFLSHVNPYTGRSLSDEPALVFLCTQNECLLDEDFKGMCAVPELGVAEKWAQFVAEAREGNPGAWPGISPNRPSDRTLPWDIEAGKDAALFGFWNWLHARFFRRVEAFLRDELGVKALLTGDNFCLISGSVLEMQDSIYGYCDQHIYMNNKLRWIDRNWAAPLAADARNPILRTWGMLEDSCGYMRLLNKPFCVTEWNYKGLNAYRSMAGLAFGSMASLQGWSGMWRFAYSHNRTMFGDNKGAPEHFDMARDPLALASDRATLALYLRGDMAEAERSLAVDYTDNVLDPAKGRGWRVEPGLPNDVAWTHRVGSVIRGKGAPNGARVVARDECAKIDRESLAAPSAGVAIDRKHGTFAVTTPRTCGVFAEGGAYTAGVLRVEICGSTEAVAQNSDKGDAGAAPPAHTPATVFATSLDGAPLAESRHILVTHLTDCRARGFTTTDELGSIILRWNGSGNPDGTMPLYLKDGAAEIELACTASANADGWRVWALGTDGKRECEVPCAFDSAVGTIRFTASVRQPFGGCMLYEIVR